MSTRTVMVGILALFCGISATIGVNALRSTAVVDPDADKEFVVIAKAGIEYGSRLSAEKLTVVQWPKESIPSKAFSSIDEVVGQYTLASFVTSEPLISSKLSHTPTMLQVPKGMRGVTISTPKESTMVAGLLVPGNHVDLMLTIASRHDILGDPTTMTLIENLTILAVGQQIDQPKGNVDARATKSVTLLVTPEMAEEINLAASLGTLNLALRNTDDKEIGPRHKINLKTLLAAPQAASEALVRKQAEERKIAEEKAAKEAAEEKQRLAEAAKREVQREKQIAAVVEEMSKFKQFVVDQFATAKKQAEEAEPAEPVPTKLDIPIGMRAVTIMTPDEASGVAGLLQPDDKVDVILTTSNKQLASGQADVTTMTMLENIKVIAVGKRVERESGSDEKSIARSITMLVTPDMAQDLNLGSKVGRLNLALRSKNDEVMRGPRRTVNLGELLSETTVPEVVVLSGEPETEVKVKNPKWKKSVVRVFRGGSAQDLTFYHPNPAHEQQD